MILYHSPDAVLTLNLASGFLHLDYQATKLSASFQQVYQLALEEMRAPDIYKLLLDIKRNAPPTDDLEHLLRPLAEATRRQPTKCLFIATLVSEGQYQYQVSGSIASAPLSPPQVEFNYFTSLRDATEWLSEN